MSVARAWSLVAAAAICCSACNRAQADPDRSSSDDRASASSAGDTSAEVKGGETYPEYDARRDALGGSAGSYAGYGCTEDCSGHEAGYQWAEDHEISDPDDCGGTSWSFEEGCRAFAEGQAGESDHQSDGSDDESNGSDDPSE